MNCMHRRRTGVLHCVVLAYSSFLIPIPHSSFLLDPLALIGIYNGPLLRSTLSLSLSLPLNPNSTIAPTSLSLIVVVSPLVISSYLTCAPCSTRW